MTDYEYKEICKCCGLTITIFAQKDNDPEYYTDLDVVCVCGERVPFSLPVN